ncbi:MAG: InlB B-repeat-containing protein [Treponema sp.]|nr:InlB B-repeat-containing protein [Treponema sp.]
MKKSNRLCAIGFAGKIMALAMSAVAIVACGGNDDREPWESTDISFTLTNNTHRTITEIFVSGIDDPSNYRGRRIPVHIAPFQTSPVLGPFKAVAASRSSDNVLNYFIGIGPHPNLDSSLNHVIWSHISLDAPPGFVELYVERRIAYDLNGGNSSWELEDQIVNFGGYAYLHYGDSLTKSGHVFAGWNTNSSGTGTTYSSGSAFSPTSSITLFAKWDAVGGGGGNGSGVEVPGSFLGTWVYGPDSTLFGFPLTMTLTITTSGWSITENGASVGSGTHTYNNATSVLDLNSGTTRYGQVYFQTANGFFRYYGTVMGTQPTFAMHFLPQ